MRRYDDSRGWMDLPRLRMRLSPAYMQVALDDCQSCNILNIFAKASSRRSCLSNDDLSMLLPKLHMHPGVLSSPLRCRTWPCASLFFAPLSRLGSGSSCEGGRRYDLALSASSQLEPRPMGNGTQDMSVNTMKDVKRLQTLWRNGLRKRPQHLHHIRHSHPLSVILAQGLRQTHTHCQGTTLAPVHQLGT